MWLRHVGGEIWFWKIGNLESLSFMRYIVLVIHHVSGSIIRIFHYFPSKKPHVWWYCLSCQHVETGSHLADKGPLKLRMAVALRYNTESAWTDILWHIHLTREIFQCFWRWLWLWQWHTMAMTMLATKGVQNCWCFSVSVGCQAAGAVAIVAARKTRWNP